MNERLLDALPLWGFCSLYEVGLIIDPDRPPGDLLRGSQTGLVELQIQLPRGP